MQEHVLPPMFSEEVKDLGGYRSREIHTHTVCDLVSRGVRAAVGRIGQASLLAVAAAMVAPCAAHAAVVIVTVTGYVTSGQDTTGVFGFPPGHSFSTSTTPYKLVFAIDDSEGTNRVQYSGNVPVESLYSTTKKSFHSTASLQINGVTWVFDALPDAKKGGVSAQGTAGDTASPIPTGGAYEIESEGASGSQLITMVLVPGSSAWPGTWNWETSFTDSAVTATFVASPSFNIDFPDANKVASGQLLPQTITVSGPISPNPAPITLASAVQVPTGVSPGPGYHIVAADFQSNGNQDLAVTDLMNASVSVVLGNGKGKFKTPVVYHTGTDPVGIVARDFNGDGLNDLAVTNSYDNTVSILLNLGKGVFPVQPSFTYPVGNTPAAVTSADLNNDGFLDLVVTNVTSNTVSVLLGKGDGSFQSAVSYYTGGTESTSTAVMDLNNDGHPDLVISASYTTVMLNDGTGKFSLQSAYPGSSSVAIGDFNGDGYPDVVTNGLTVMLNDKKGNLLPGTTYAAGRYPASVLAQDLNGDGTLDLAVANTVDGTISLLLGKGDGTFVTQPAVSAGSQPESLAVADFNGDNKPDIAFSTLSTGTIGVLFQTTSSKP